MHIIYLIYLHVISYYYICITRSLSPCVVCVCFEACVCVCVAANKFQWPMAVRSYHFNSHTNTHDCWKSIMDCVKQISYLSVHNCKNIICFRTNLLTNTHWNDRNLNIFIQFYFFCAGKNQFFALQHIQLFRPGAELVGRSIIILGLSRSTFCADAGLAVAVGHC